MPTNGLLVVSDSADPNKTLRGFSRIGGTPIVKHQPSISATYPTKLQKQKGESSGMNLSFRMEQLKALTRNTLATESARALDVF